MASELIILSLLICVFTYEVTCSPVRNGRCNMLYQAVRRCRNEFYYKRDRVLYRADAADFQQTYITPQEQLLGFTMDDSHQLRQAVCQITEATSAEEIATILRYPVSEVRENLNMWGLLQSILIDEWTVAKPFLVNTHAWLIKSGFPDNWPLTVDYNETFALLMGHGIRGSNRPDWAFNSADQRRMLRNLLSFGQLSCSKSISKSLTEATSFADYLSRIQTSLQSNPKIPMFTTYARNLRQASVLRDILGAGDSIVNLCQVISKTIIPQIRGRSYYSYFYS